MQVSKIKELDRLLELHGYEADAVSMDQDSLLSIKTEYQQTFEKNYVTFFDIENYFGVKILLLHEANSKKEFELYTKLKKRD
jgi:hypothetical protein